MIGADFYLPFPSPNKQCQSTEGTDSTQLNQAQSSSAHHPFWISWLTADAGDVASSMTAPRCLWCQEEHQPKSLQWRQLKSHNLILLVGRSESLTVECLVWRWFITACQRFWLVISCYDGCQLSCNFWLVEDQLDVWHVTARVVTHLIFAGMSRFLAPLSHFPS